MGVTHRLRYWVHQGVTHIVYRDKQTTFYKSLCLITLASTSHRSVEDGCVPTCFLCISREPAAQVVMRIRQNVEEGKKQ